MGIEHVHGVFIHVCRIHYSAPITGPLGSLRKRKRQEHDHEINNGTERGEGELLGEPSWEDGVIE